MRQLTQGWGSVWRQGGYWNRGQARWTQSKQTGSCTLQAEMPFQLQRAPSRSKCPALARSASEGSRDMSESDRGWSQSGIRGTPPADPACLTHQAQAPDTLQAPTELEYVTAGDVDPCLEQGLLGFCPSPLLVAVAAALLVTAPHARKLVCMQWDLTIGRVLSKRRDPPETIGSREWHMHAYSPLLPAPARTCSLPKITVPQAACTAPVLPAGRWAAEGPQSLQLTTHWRFPRCRR